METEATSGAQALSWLDSNGWLQPASLDSAKQQEIYNGFQGLFKDLHLEKHYRLYFRSSGYMGPNAFAALMERLPKERPERHRRLTWLSTHPSSSQRVEKARTAAEE